MKKGILIASILFVAAQLFAQTLPPGVSPELARQFANAQGGSSLDSPSGLKIPTPNMAMANKDYRVTAGDVYNLALLAGNTPVQYMITVDSNYRIRVANLAVLSVDNMKFQTLKQQVEEIVTKNYPMSGVQFTLVTPGSFNIVVKGETAQAKEVGAWALTRLSEVVNVFKNQYGSIRNVKVQSVNGKEKTYDLFLAQRDGNFNEDPYVRPGDIITIMPKEREVVVSGAVKRPGTYELKEGENLKDLIYTYADGFAHMADTTSLELIRTYDTTEATGQKIFLKEENVNDNYPLKPYDAITVKSFKSQLPVVFVQGAITGDNSGDPRPNTTVSQKINFNIGETYEQFVFNVKRMFGSNADLTRAYVMRGEELIPINIYEILYNDAACDVAIKPNDVLTIPSKTLSVSVVGAVRVPGRYPYFPDKDWSYYVELAGGFIREANSFDSISIVDADGNKLDKDDPITPETKITAKVNDFLYYFNTYSPVILTTLGMITSVFSVIALFQK